MHGLNWNTGESTMKDSIEDLILTTKKEKKNILLRELFGKEIQIYVINLHYCYCPNIKILYKVNPNIEICGNHNNFNHTCAVKNLIF